MAHFGVFLSLISLLTPLLLLILSHSSLFHPSHLPCHTLSPAFPLSLIPSKDGTLLSIPEIVHQLEYIVQDSARTEDKQPNVSILTSGSFLIHLPLSLFIT